MPDLTRRSVVQGTAALTALSVLSSPRSAGAFPGSPGDEVLTWLDQPPPLDDPTVESQFVWEDFDSWITPNDRFFKVTHFGWPVINPATWTLRIDGLVRRPLRMTLDDLRSRVRREETVTLECSGNHGFPDFTGGIGTAKWTGTPLAPLLEEAGVLAGGVEVVFWGADQGEVTLKDAIRDVSMNQHFARSMSLADAMSPDNLLAYGMNGETLPEKNGYPLRLISPGWYGIANVKWLTRIEVRDRRLMNKFMGRDYVTIRAETEDGETVWAESSVGRTRLKSAPAKVVRNGSLHRVIGAAWGAPIDRVEVRIDDGPWTVAVIDRTEEAPFAWRIWSVEWPDATPGEHAVTSRAIDTSGNIQPAMDDSFITGKHTYWESNGQITRRVMIGA